MNVGIFIHTTTNINKKNKKSARGAYAKSIINFNIEQFKIDIQDGEGEVDVTGCINNT